MLMPAIIAGFLTVSSAASGALGPYNVTSVTVSGLSAGAYFAVQLHIAYSSVFSGAAIYAGGPYYCAQGSMNTALGPCMSGSEGGPQTAELISLTNQFSALGTIDDVSNINDQGHKVYIFSGERDTVVDQSVILSLQEYYYSFLASEDKLTSDFDLPSSHCVPTLDYGEECDRFEEPYLGKCDYDGAGTGLQAIYPEGTFTNGRVEMVDRNFFAFDQIPFIPPLTLKYGDPYWSLGQMGFIYVPTTCQDGTTPCSLHVSLHGCEQTVDDMDDTFARHAGFNEWAEGNNMIVLYPMTKRTMNTANAYNPNGCWDWWGYTGEKYAEKGGVQMTFIKNLIDTISGNAF